ncbi:dihydrolipoamide acetyltransferase family protein [Baekduia soli]|uniref:dihydrolipoamide acetyltransferase family protein n=1 Tax=Baekduia soli TaxID=496014 RepID=UPI001E5F7B75|nr:dihydrolipoamide acetyltransferase family protein [Baekduia soli]
MAGAAPEPATAGIKGETTTVELSRLQQTVARRMAESRATIPDFSLQMDVDASALLALRDRLRELGDHPPSVNDLVVKAAALALVRHPRVNASWRDGAVELYARVNVGVAVAAEQGLVVPTIADADRKSLGTIAAEARALAERVRAAEITPPELAGGTFTVSNLGMFGVSAFTAVINPPQAAILAVGAVREVPAVRDGALVAVPTMGLTLCCDHRVLDGSQGARYLAEVRDLLEQPLRLAL